MIGKGTSQTKLTQRLNIAHISGNGSPKSRVLVDPTFHYKINVAELAGKKFLEQSIVVDGLKRLVLTN